MNLDDSLTALGIAICLGVLAALVTLGATAYVAVCRALDTRTDRRARQAAHTHHVASTAAIDDAVTLALDDACCETWWTSTATDHDPTCPNHTRKHR